MPTLFARSLRHGQQLHALHQQAQPLLMPNAWDAGSAMLLAAQGFAAIGTTSAGIAFSLGQPDQESAVPFARMLARIAEIAAAVEVPVSADLQSGYGDTPAAVADSLSQLIAVGAVGANLEDARPDQAGLFSQTDACTRIAAARQAADASGVPFVLTARCDAFLQTVADPLSEAIARCQAYRAAGADCLFVPGPTDAATLAALVQGVDGPLSVVMGLAGSPLTVAQLAALGVRRISIGGSLARACLGLVRRAAEEMQQHGSFAYASQQIPDGELSAFFADRRRALGG